MLASCIQAAHVWHPARASIVKTISLVLTVLALAGCQMLMPYMSRVHSPSSNRIDMLTNRLENPVPSDVMVVAHRACWVEGAPENSLSAIAECIRLGIDMIEIDVALTSDGVPVLMHDATIDRTTNGQGRANDLSLDELQSLHLRAGAGGSDVALTSESPPTLEEALHLAKGKILINLDAKGDIFAPAFKLVQNAGMEQQILMKMRARPDDTALTDMAFLGKTHFMPIVSQCRAAAPAQVCMPRLSTAVAQYRQFDPVAYEITFQTDSYLREALEQIQDSGARLWVNTLAPHHAAGRTDSNALIDPEKNWGQLIEAGVNIIQTDYPERLTEYLAKTDGEHHGH